MLYMIFVCEIREEELSDFIINREKPGWYYGKSRYSQVIVLTYKLTWHKFAVIICDKFAYHSFVPEMKLHLHKQSMSCTVPMDCFLKKHSIFNIISEHTSLEDVWSGKIIGRDIDQIFTNIRSAVLADPVAKDNLTKVIISLSDMYMINKALKEHPEFVRHDDFYNDLRAECQQYLRLCDRIKHKSE